DPDLPSGFDGSAVVHATQPVAAIVNRVNYTSTQASAASLTIPTVATAMQFTVPLVYGGVNGYVTTLSIQNTGAVPATYTINLQANGFAAPTTTVQVTIPALAVRRIHVGTDVSVPPNFIGSAVISSPTSPLTAVGESINASTSILLSYAGF